jgi:RNA polymerase sigma-70 factor (ECF subfamily)
MPKLVHNLFLVSGDLQRAEDCAQEAFIRAWQRWPKLTGDDPASWVYAVGWRLCIDEWRSGRRRRARMEKTAESRRADVPPPGAEEARALIAALSPSQRSVVVLFYVEDLAVDDVARILRLPTGTVKSRLSRAREKLRDLHVRTEEENP